MTKGFTLIELLVCLAIVALLMAILLPVLYQSRLNAQKSVCQSNLHSLGQSIRLYVDDNDEKWPLFSTWPDWNHLNSSPLPGCPNITATVANQKYPSAVKGYAYSYPLATAETADEIKRTHKTVLIAARDSDIPFPATTVAVVDVAIEYIFAAAPDPNKYLTPYNYGPERGWERHNGGANYLFCDNHVKWLRENDVLPALPPINDGTKASFALKTGEE